ncbi:SagB/ThcOx family dehydrogenase, partial [Methylogaea oryzae]|uniref:SagB/ThcOx family dehydrogenase n=1 Tax=Methylogaea oryzae TaxID=1295382 RepID=UPI00138F30E6
MNEDMSAAAQAVRDYHRRSKHHLDRYAAGPGFMDWDTQPEPFRSWEAPSKRRCLSGDGVATPYADLFRPAAVAAAPLDLDGLGALLQLSFGLSAWKQSGTDRWALRCNPSSGNLHPTEVYLAAAGVPRLADGVYHYNSYGHVLERRCAASLSGSGVLLGLSSVHWREAWKYGERAFRYCQHDVGHALAALRYAAAALAGACVCWTTGATTRSPRCWDWTATRISPARKKNSPICSAASSPARLPVSKRPPPLGW